MTVNAQILTFCVGSARNDQPPGQQGGNVARPAVLQGDVVQVDIGAFDDNVMTGCAFDVLGAHVPEGGLQHGYLGNGVAQAFGCFRFAQRRQQLTDVTQGADIFSSHAQGHPAGGAEQIGEYGHFGGGIIVDRVFEQQRRPLLLQNAVADIGHFKPG